MSQKQQQPQQNQINAAALAQQGLAPPAYDSTLAPGSDALAQLASQVQATMGASQQIQASTAPQVPRQVNPNVAITQLMPVHGQVQNGVVPMGTVPMMWSGTPSAAAYHIPQAPGWVTNQVVVPQTAAAVQRTVQMAAPAGTVLPNPTMGTTVPPPQPIPAPLVSASNVVPENLVSNEATAEKSKDKATRRSSSASELSTEQKAKQNRERNREHARSTRLRKKAYVQKLKEMAEGLRTIQTEEIRQRRQAVQKMMDMQKLRRTVIQSVLKFHSSYESDATKWQPLLEEGFWFKQPVTPYRYFRKSEVEKDSRVLSGLESMICDAASISTMVERIGYRNSRWQRIKRKTFLQSQKNGTDIVNVLDGAVGGGIQATESSLSSASSTDSGSSSPERTSRRTDHAAANTSKHSANENGGGKNVVSSSDSSRGRQALAFVRGDVYSEDSSAVIAATKKGDGPSGNSKRESDGEARRAKRQKGSNNVSLSGDGRDDVPLKPENSSVPSGPSSSRSYSGGPTIILSSLDFLSKKADEISAYYAVNEDDMIMIDDVLMCPFVFRTKNAVLCGALADCVMPGMLRANFSKTNKLASLEIVFDAMGFMQQLDGANGGNVTAQVIPGSLEMALMHNPHEARVITESKPPYCVVHVNEKWSELLKYSQVEVEGRELRGIIEGPATDPNAGKRPGKPMHTFEEVAKGRPACSTNIHYDKFGSTFVDFMCSYPLRNATDEITHLLHVNQALPEANALV